MYNTWEELKSACENCHRCELCETRTNVVVGVGNENAEVHIYRFVAEETFDAYLYQLVEGKQKFASQIMTSKSPVRSCEDIDETELSYAEINMVKCRPPKNRDPKPEEQEMCIEWLRTQVRMIKPKIIVCLGRIAAARLIKSDIKITKEHGQWIEKNGVLMMAMLHPAAILRDPRRKPDAFDDFLKLRDKINEVCDHTYE